MSLSNSPTYFRIFYFPSSHTTLKAWFKCYQITSRPVNQAICIFIILPIVMCNLVSTNYYYYMLVIHICNCEATFKTEQLNRIKSCKLCSQWKRYCFSGRCQLHLLVTWLMLTHVMIRGVSLADKITSFRLIFGQVSPIPKISEILDKYCVKSGEFPDILWHYIIYISWVVICQQSLIIHVSLEIWASEGRMLIQCFPGVGPVLAGCCCVPAKATLQGKWKCCTRSHATTKCRSRHSKFILPDYTHSQDDQVNTSSACHDQVLKPAAD